MSVILIITFETLIIAQLTMSD